MTTDTSGGICPACKASPRGYCDPCGRRADVTGPTEEEREMERLKARLAEAERQRDLNRELLRDERKGRRLAGRAIKRMAGERCLLIEAQARVSEAAEERHERTRVEAAELRTALEAERRRTWRWVRRAATFRDAARFFRRVNDAFWTGEFACSVCGCDTNNGICAGCRHGTSEFVVMRKERDAARAALETVREVIEAEQDEARKPGEDQAAMLARVCTARRIRDLSGLGGKEGQR